MTIQFHPVTCNVRVGDRHFPALPFDHNDEPGPYGKGFRILLGETGKELSIAIGAGTYSDNYHAYLHQDTVIDVEAELELVEVGFAFGGTVGGHQEWQHRNNRHRNNWLM